MITTIFDITLLITFIDFEAHTFTIALVNKSTYSKFIPT